MKFERGYKPVRDKISKGSKYTMSCYNCEYFYQSFGDKEEVCQNQNVLKYDMVVTQNNIYCNYWKMSKRKSSTSFKKGVEFCGHKEKITKPRKKSR